jgi:integrase
MPKQTRQSTVYSGIYFVNLANDDQSFFIRYKQNGKSFEERAGRSSQGWNAEKAYFMRKERITGLNPPGSDTWTTANNANGQNNWTFSGIFEAYLRLRPDLRGRENDIYRFRNYLHEDFGSITPAEVVPDDIERFRYNLQKQQLKPATVRHALELLRRLANFAAKKKFCPGLSFKIEMPTVENHKTEDLTQLQLETLLQVLEEEPDKQVSNMVRLALYTGLRRGEMFSLKWNDIDFYNKTITIRPEKKGRHTSIPLNEMAEKVLEEHAHLEAKSEFVFPGRGGKKRTECKRPLLRIKKNAGLPDDFRLLQGLRHVYASMLASSGEVDMETLQSLLTHKSPLMTQRYAHLRETALNNSIDEFEATADSVTQIEEEQMIQDYSAESYDSDFAEEESVDDIEMSAYQTELSEVTQIIDDTEENTDSVCVDAGEEETSLFEDELTENAEEKQELELSEETVEQVNAAEQAEDIILAEESEEMVSVEVQAEGSDLAEEIMETDSFEVQDYDRSILEDESSEYSEDTQFNDFTEENAISDNFQAEIPGTPESEINADNLIQETALDDSVVNEVTSSPVEEEHEELTTSGEEPAVSAEAIVECSERDQELSDQVEAYPEVPDSKTAISTKTVKSVPSSEIAGTTEQPEKVLRMQSVFHSKTDKNVESPNSLKEVKIDSKTDAENETDENKSGQSARPTISDLKKELMSLSELIKSSPSKLKSTAEARNS